jgi:dTDP-glucose pyrophosphorylase
MPTITRVTNLEAVTCAPTMRISAFLKRLNLSDYLFFVVIDEDGRPLGTITDGDVRRAILDGATLEDPTSRCMHTGSLFGKVGAAAENAELLKDVPFLPLVNDAGRIVEVLIPSDSTPGISTALVMAGGKGQRLGEHTRNKPKPLLAVGNQPILQHILNDLEAAGVENIFISVHYLADQITEFLNSRDNTASIQIVEEQEMLGTAGALGQLPEPLGNPILVVNGDLITRTDFQALNNFHWRHGYDASIAVAHHETEVQFGVIKKDSNGVFLGIEEKPVIRHFVAAGIYYLSPEFCALVPRNTPMDMPSLLNLGREIGLKVGLFPIHESWIDVGRPADLQRADENFNPPEKA